MTASAWTPDRVLYLWGLDSGQPRQAGLNRAERHGQSAFSLLLLAQSIRRNKITTPITIGAVSNNAYRLGADTASQPEQAILLGLCGALGEEHPNLTCRGIDVVAPASEQEQEELIDNLIAELSGDAEEEIVAYRSNHRWVQTLEPVPLAKQAGSAGILRQRGVYLITGGLGSLGLEFANNLAKETQARLALVDACDLPEREQWEEVMRAESGAGDISPNMAAPSGAEQRIETDIEAEIDYICWLEEAADRKSGKKRLGSYAGLEEKGNELCTSLVLDYLAGKVDIGRGRSYYRDELKRALAIAPRYEKLFDFLLRSLATDGVIALDGDRIEFLKEKGDLNDAEMLKSELCEEYPQFNAIFELLDRCVTNYDKALSGQVEAMGVLLPDGSADALAESSRSTEQYSNYRTYFQVLGDLIAKIVKQSGGRRVRLLEVGGGSGYLTRSVVPAIMDQNVEYHFTDLGKSFIIRAEREASQYGLTFMRFGTLDISKDPVEQGYEEESFDLVLAFNVVHATSRIRDTIGNLKRLLSANGMLLLLESAEVPRWETLTWGLAEGWWYFEDYDLRTQSPLLPVDRWESVLKDCGFSKVQGFPVEPAMRAAFDHGLIVAQKEALSLIPGYARKAEELVTRRRISRLRDIEALGSEVLVLKADLSRRDQMEQAFGEIRRRFGEVNGAIQAAVDTDRAPSHSLAMERSLDKSIQETVILRDLVGGAEADFLALFSSSAKRAVGRIAGAFNDATAIASPSSDATRVFSVTWEGLEEGPVPQADEGPDGAIARVSHQEAFEAFKRTLANGSIPRVLLCERNPHLHREEGRTTVPGDSKQQGAPAETNAGEPDSPRGRTRMAVHGRPSLRTEYVAPRNHIERELVSIWQELFNIGGLGVYDNFFELGGDSLLALSLNTRLIKTFQVSVSAHVLLESPTVAQLAALIEALLPDSEMEWRSEPARPSVLVELQAGGYKTPVFLIHPGGGGVFNYRDLALALGPDQPVYGIQARGLDGREEPLTSVHQMAAHYIEAIQSVQPAGPYLLAGASFGGIVAYEMAQQLQERGEEVDLLALFDSPGPKHLDIEAQDDAAMLAVLIGGDVSFMRDRLRQLSADGQLVHFLEEMKAANRLPPDFDIEQARNIVRVWKTNAEAMDKYELKPYRGRIVFFRAREREPWLPLHPELPWIDVASEGLEVHVAPGGHDSMFARANVEHLASRLSRLIELSQTAALEAH
jgi:thioesterase domain-containing protein/NAD(P)-dependent dehydrogenase (short-subunit alcohol dehydrogenase family)